VNEASTRDEASSAST